MLGRTLSSAAWTIVFFLATLPAEAQNLDAGKSPAQIFNGACGACHKSPRGLLKTVPPASLPGFLRQHYTTSPNMAGMLSAYLLESGGGVPDRRPTAASRRERQAAPVAPPPAPEPARPSIFAPLFGGQAAPPPEPPPEAKPKRRAGTKAKSHGGAAAKAGRPSRAVHPPHGPGGGGSAEPKPDSETRPSAAPAEPVRPEADKAGGQETPARRDPVPAVTPAPQAEPRSAEQPTSEPKPAAEPKGAAPGPTEGGTTSKPPGGGASEAKPSNADQ